MSQKNLRKRPATVRVMPVETIRTRLKSSQSSQQKKISQEQNETTTRYTKTYKANTKSSPQCVDKEKRNHDTEEIESNKEFHPNKLKRLFQKKEIVLKPKPAYKLVGGLGSINKRKLRQPTKETTYVEQKMVIPKEYTKDHPGIDQRNNRSNTKAIDLIYLDDSDSLDEEDLMEILTCPSPVWWEDPPNEYYDEEPLTVTMNNKDYIIKMKNQNAKYTIEEHSSSQNNAQDKNHGRKHNIKDNSFVTKQNKLESLLGNMKNKKSKDDTLENINNKNSPKSEWQKNLSDCSNIFNEKNLDILENIDIPIEKSKQDQLPTVKVKETSHSLETHKESNIELTPSVANKSKTTNMKPVKGLTIKKCDIKQFKPKLIQRKVGHKQVQSVEEIDKNKMLFLKTWSEQCDMKVLTLNKEAEQNQPNPNQTENIVSGLTIKKPEPNIMIKQIKKRNRRKKNNKNANNEKEKKVTTQTAKSDDQITVYKILSEQDVEENKDTKIDSKTYNAQLNSYYNQVKNINSFKKEVDNKPMCVSEKIVCNNNQTVKSIPVSNNETVKYCLQCSSIFDNDTCNYCAIKSTDAKPGSNVKTDPS